jgi:hypothetical protein
MDIGGQVEHKPVVLFNTILDVEAVTVGVEGSVTKDLSTVSLMDDHTTEHRVVDGVISEVRVGVISRAVEVKGIATELVQLTHLDGLNTNNTTFTTNQDVTTNAVEGITVTMELDAASQEANLSLVLDTSIVVEVESRVELDDTAIVLVNRDNGPDLVLVVLLVTVDGGHDDNFLSRFPVHLTLKVDD